MVGSAPDAPGSVSRRYLDARDSLLAIDTIDACTSCSPRRYTVVRRSMLQNVLPETLGVIEWQNMVGRPWAENTGFQWQSPDSIKNPLRYIGTLQADHSFYVQFSTLTPFMGDSLYGEIAVRPDGLGRGFVFSNRQHIKYKICVDLNDSTTVETWPAPILPCGAEDP